MKILGLFGCFKDYKITCILKFNNISDDALVFEFITSGGASTIIVVIVIVIVIVVYA